MSDIRHVLSYNCCKTSDAINCITVIRHQASGICQRSEIKSLCLSKIKNVLIWYMFDIWYHTSDIRRLLSYNCYQTSDVICYVITVIRRLMSMMFVFWYQTSHVRCLTSEVWCQTSDVWYETCDVFEVLYQTYAIWCPTFHIRCLMFVVWCQTSALRLLMSDIRHLMSGACYQTSDIRHLTCDVWCLYSVTYVILCYITCVMLCYITCFMLWYITYVMLSYITYLMLCSITYLMSCYITENMLCYITYVI